MKKDLYILLLFFVCSANAQNSHLMFMGIPIDGSIDIFQNKLEEKGFKQMPCHEAYPQNTKVFEGFFSGELSTIFVWYNPHTKTVYRTKAMITRESKDLIGQLLEIMENKLVLKYGDDHLIKMPVKDDFGHEFTQYSRFFDNGSIDLFVSSTGYSSQNTFFLQVDYKDKDNSNKNIKDEVDDL